MLKFKSLFILFFIFVILSIFLWFTFGLKVTVECKSQYGQCPQEIVSGIKNLKLGNLFQTKIKVSKYLKTNLLVSDFSTQFKLPNILLVNILIKKPSFVIKNESSQIELISEDGKVLEIGNSSGLPTLIISGNLKKIGEKIDGNQFFALNLIRGVNDMYQVNTGKIIDDSLVVELPSGIRVIFPMDGDVNVLLGSLRVIYTKIETTGQTGKYSEIDLRFKNPVLR